MDTQIEFCDGSTQKEAYLRNSEKAQEILGRFHSMGKPAFCLCNDEGKVKLAIKKRTKFFLAAYPNTGPLHHYLCIHYQKAPDVLSGAAQLTENARKEHDGKIYISCRVGLTRREEKEDKAPEEDQTPVEEEDIEVSEEEEKEKQSLRRIALYDVALEFWLGSQLNQWVPAFAGHRSWGSVRKRLSTFTSNVYVNRLPMTKVLYIPHFYKKELEEEISKAKTRFFSQWQGVANKDFLVIGELRDLQQTEHGYCLKLVHENYSFFMSADIYKALSKRFSFEIGIHDKNQQPDADPTGRVLVVMSCNMPSKYITVRSVCLIGLNNDYIPVLNQYELEVADKLVKEGRTFYRPAKSRKSEHGVADFVLVDTEKETVLGIFDANEDDYDSYCEEKLIGLDSLGYPKWVWATHESNVIPDFPPISNSSEN